ncbi:MAG: hypothetical protein Kow00123_18360 [Anaerolineales bacterium]
MDAHVYALQGTPDALERWAESLGQPLVHWVADGARFTMGSGLPHDWKMMGAVFGPSGELRWWRAENTYRALLLADQQVSGLTPLPGTWSAEEEDVYLQNLGDRSLNPNFAVYPHPHDKASGKVSARVYSRDGVRMFVSPRRLKEG